MKSLYLNPDDSLFCESLADLFYIDKSMLIEETNKAIGTKSKFVCVSRARRFGKSTALEMLAAYYAKGSNGRAFHGLQIEKSISFSEHLGKYNVLMFDLNSFYDNCIGDKTKMFRDIFDAVASEFTYQFPNIVFKGRSVASLLRDVYSNTGEKFVVLIDEYDVLARKNVSEPLFEAYLEFLNGLFKNNDITRTIALAYITGILPVVREKFQSKLNNFIEYTMISAANMSKYFGFTADEVRSVCQKFHIDEDECRKWYDGYNINGTEIFSPKSIHEAARRGETGNYWAATGSFEAVSDYISLDFEGIIEDVNRLIAGEEVKADVSTYENKIDSSAFRCKDDVFTYCIHLGYLSYNSSSKSVRIPNYEVRMQWIAAIKSVSKFSETRKIISLSEKIIYNICEYRSDLVAESIEASHSAVTSNLSYNNEQSLQSAILLSFISARDRYTIVPEFPAGKGYADVVLIPYKPKKSDPAIVVELKVEGTVKTGIGQIRKREYPKSLKHCENNLILVSISYDKKTKKHSAVVERFR